MYRYSATFCMLFICGCILLTLSSCTQKTEVLPASPQSVLAAPVLLSTIADDEVPDGIDPNAKHSPVKDYQMQPLKKKEQAVFAVSIHRGGHGVAYLARVGAKMRVVHNGKPGKFYKEIDAANITLSPDGRRVAYSAFENDRYQVVVDDHEYGLYNEIGAPVFSPDSRHVAFECKIGPSWYINVDGLKSDPSEPFSSIPAFSQDSQTVIIYENGIGNKSSRVGFSDLRFKKTVYKDIYGAALISNDKSRIAFVQQAGKQFKLISFSVNTPDVVSEGPLFDSIGEKKLSDDGSVAAYIGKRGAVSYIVLGDKEERLPVGDYTWPLVVRPDNKSVGLFNVKEVGPRMVNAYFIETFTNNGAKNVSYVDATELTYSRDSRHYAYVVFKDDKSRIVLNGKEGAAFERIVSLQFSPDGKYLVCRARQNGKRFMVVIDTLSGNISKKHDVHERVFEPTFTDDGKSVAYGVQDGKKIMWVVERL